MKEVVEKMIMKEFTRITIISRNLRKLFKLLKKKKSIIE